jgi:chitinase
MSDRGAVDNAQLWEQFSDSYRAQVIADYHAAGIALMVSAFGSTDSPTMNNVDPTTCAQQLAAWVIKYKMDGVDIDYEDMLAMNSNRAEGWLITFQKELRRLLPAGQYIISHAPVAPWFTSARDYVSGAYVKINQEVGSTIDFVSTTLFTST